MQTKKVERDGEYCKLLEEYLTVLGFIKLKIKQTVCQTKPGSK
jgi:hypothetical protein